MLAFAMFVVMVMLFAYVVSFTSWTRVFGRYGHGLVIFRFVV